MNRSSKNTHGVAMRSGTLVLGAFASAAAAAAADHRRRRQELHRAADHGGDDGAAAAGQGLQGRTRPAWAARCCARRRRAARSTSTGSTPARRSSPTTRSPTDARARRDLRQGEGARRRQGPRLAQPVEGEQHLCARDERRTMRRSRASPRSPTSPAKVKGGAQAEVRLQRRVLCAARRPEAARADVRLRVRPREREAHGHRPRLPGAEGAAGRRRAGLRDRRAHSGVRLRHAAATTRASSRPTR